MRTSGYEPGGRRFESCRAHHPFRKHSKTSRLGLPSQDVSTSRYPSISAWQTAWQAVRVADRVAFGLAETYAGGQSTVAKKRRRKSSRPEVLSSNVIIN